MSQPAARLTPVQWVICGVAALGFAFDVYELLMLPLIVRPALLELIGAAPGTPDFNLWVGLLFFVPAVAGGGFGLLGGYLTDLFGRRRVLVWSILLYAGSALAAGFSTSIEMLLVLRCTTFIGVVVEFVAAVAWLAELFPVPKRREAVLGYTQAFSSIGGLLVSGAYFFIVTYAESLPEIRGGHEPWRYTLMSGVVPALPLIVIRPFLPESPTWYAKKMAGTLKRPSIAELFRPEFRRTTIVTTIMFACAYGAAFGALQQAPRIVPGLEGIADLARTQQEQAVGTVQFLQEMGGLTGRLLLAFFAVRIVARRRLLRLFQTPGLFVVPLVFLFATTTSLPVLQFGLFLAGVCTVAQFSFWGNYLPRVFPTHLRGTGESFAANIGGRMIGTSFAMVTTQLTNVMPGENPTEQLAYAAAAVGLLVYAAGFTASFWLPEPQGEELPE
ncbi:MAG: MFS transporter [Vicinamibacterales bacterium]|jgi:MFS family permease|nr:MFS transporter [Vicinamibacterales bacterium]